MAVSSPPPPPPPPPSTEPLQDAWTPTQELTLLKSLVHYKPVGLHAHFRMLAIRNYLVQSGNIDADAAHTRIPGIWAKLGTLYDLDKLDEREDAVIGSGSGSGDEGDGAGPDHWRDFDLGRDGDFEGLMWQRRLAPEATPDGSESETEERSARGTRAGTLRKAEIEDTEEDEVMEDVGSEDGEDEDDDDSDDSDDSDDDDDEEEEEEEKKSGPPAKRGRGGGRGRGGRGKRGRRRG